MPPPHTEIPAPRKRVLRAPPPASQPSELLYPIRGCPRSCAPEPPLYRVAIQKLSDGRVLVIDHCQDPVADAVQKTCGQPGIEHQILALERWLFAHRGDYDATVAT